MFFYLESDDNGDFEFEFFGSSDDTLSNDVASHDTAEDVDEDGFNLGVGGDQSEGFLDLVSGSSA